ncbi:hypothetical protein AB0F15_21585 [Amycolatopsis sp. NPDC026612]|uniref:hypothetical protein n=1 Tax=Amycolatopsis sp. NPDC026612 TaxID=3155466 RepID=UPI0033DA4688
MTVTRLGQAQQVLLLCALAVCVMAMHHISLSHGMPGTASATAAHVVPGGAPGMADPAPGSESGEHRPGMPTGLHDLLHLCLAVLYAAGALLLALGAFLVVSWLTTSFPRSSGLRGSPRRGRPPDRGGREILTSLCVLRT